ncbi:sensor histidine kinase [Flavobacterium sp. N1736]|uniref:sensor histidine kinase n=1 Tax=Flavobacterium sp. N1736 TaxID=2986823 RepID=UPI002224C9C9|nr:histidine kinase [Flavobacterium sp. N1736]
MKKKIFLFTLAFIVFYMMSFGMRQLPNLVHGRFDIPYGRYHLKTWLRFIVDMMLYYGLSFGTYLVLHQFYPVRKMLTIFVLILLLSVSFFYLSFFWTSFIENSPIRSRNHFHLVSFTAIINIAFACVFYLIRYSKYRDLQNVKLQLQNRQTELLFLRSQVNPHFLFNNLNNIYSLVLENSNQALPAISHLAELLRYMLYDAGEKIALEKEVDYLEKFIYLQQLRFEKPSAIQFEIDIKDGQQLLPPLILVPFIENAFKHGAIKSDQIWLKIILKSDAEQLFFQCSNLTSKNNTDAVGGIGIENVKKRLDLLYPDNHNLKIEKDNAWFAVKLIIKNDK